MGEVLKAVDRRLRRPVAIKRVGDLVHHPQAIARFLIEARAVAALNHFNIVQVYDYGRSTEGPFLAMEFVDGESLAQRLREPLPVEDAVDITCQLCDALSLAHGRGIIHRDIKPANILLTSTGVPKLSDFGLARQQGTDHGQTQTGAVLGTLDFMPPEQRLDATRVDARSDLWSLGATLYQMVTGKPPKVIRFTHVPSVLQPILERVLEDDPGKRFQTAVELQQALRDVLGRLRTTAASSVVIGQCPKCGTIKDPNRKFCLQCGGSLKSPCPKCGVPAGTWEQFCGECGTNFAQEIEILLQDAASRQQQIEQFRSQHRHAEALPFLAELAALDHPALTRTRDWARQVQPVIRAELKKLEGERSQLFEEARKRFQDFDDEHTLRLLDGIPPPLRTAEVNALMVQANSRREEAQWLTGEIRSAVQARHYEGLLAKTTRLLDLRPRDESLVKLHKQLNTREERARTKAQRLAASPTSFRAPSTSHFAAADVSPAGKGKPRPQSWLNPPRVVVGATAIGVLLIVLVLFRPDTQPAPKPTVATDTLTNLRSAAKAGSDQPSVNMLPPPAVTQVAESNPLKSSNDGEEARPNLGEAVPTTSEVLKPINQAVLRRAKTSSGVELILIPAGEFGMGSSNRDQEAMNDEKPQRIVRITKPFFLGRYEVTKGQFSKFVAAMSYETEPERGYGGFGVDPTTGDYGRHRKHTWQMAGWTPYDDDHPVINVTWNDAVAFCNWQSEEEGLTLCYRAEGGRTSPCRGMAIDCRQKRNGSTRVAQARPQSIPVGTILSRWQPLATFSTPWRKNRRRWRSIPPSRPRMDSYSRRQLEP